MKRLNKFILITLLCLLIPSMAFGGATFSRIKTWSAAETLTASDLNAEFNNILNNLTPTGIDDESASDVAAQAVSDPYPGSALSKATSLKGEIQQIRYLLKQLTGEAYWYIDPDLDMVTLATHNPRHENGGADEINVTGLSGLLADDQHVLDSEVLNVAAAKGANSDITSLSGLTTALSVLQGGTGATTLAGANIVTASTNLTDNALVRGDGAKGVQLSTVLVSDAGEMTNPSQPAFLAYPAVAQTDIAVDGVTVVFGTEIFDQGGDFASNTFTAPITGRYLLSFSIALEDVDTAATSYTAKLITSNKTNYFSIDPNFSADLGWFYFPASIVCDMDATDTAYVQIDQSAGTVQTDISTSSFFSGGLLF